MKRKHVFLASLLACFFVFLFTGCPGQIDSHPDTVKVTFYDRGNSPKEVTVKYGEKVPSYYVPYTSYVSYNYFMFWSTSKASLAALNEFDVENTPVTQDISLYAIYTPQLCSDAITNLTATQIEVELYDDSVYPLDDGSYAGISFKHATADTDYVDLQISTPPTYVDKSGYRYLTYTFDNRLPGGDNYIKVTNGHETSSKHEWFKNLTNPKKVYFYDNGKLVKTAEVESGDTFASLTSEELPPNPSKSYNYFMYWSDSKASKATAVEFAKNIPITEDTMLYAIYTPQLSYISALTATTLELKLYDDTVFPLDDGSYAGINFQHKNLSSEDYSDYELNSIPASYEDRGGYRYLTYVFASPLSSETHYFKATNGHENVTNNITIKEPSPATSLSTEVNDSYVKVSFKPASGWGTYTIKVLSNGSEIKSTTVYSSTASAEFFGLTNGTEYTFKVITVTGGETEPSAEITATPAITKKESDWVVAMYMDGDNNLNDAIYMDMNEAEYGLYSIRNTDGTAMSSYDSVNVVALWDGVVSFEDEDESGNKVTKTPQIGKPGSYLFELGTDYSATANYTNDPGCVLSSNTKNMSYTAPWIGVSTQQVSTSQPTSGGEVNMGSKQTLINFLNWVNAHYTANKGIILQFSNHGGGPRSVICAQTEDGKTVTIGGSGDRRALCWDDTSGESEFLKTKDVSDALEATGFGTNKASIILMDVCLGSSLEDAYQFKDYAEYFAASPNNIPGLGLNYTDLIKSFKKNVTKEDIGKQMVLDYKKQYGNNSSLWNSYAQQYYNKTYNNLSNEEKIILEWQGRLGMTTFTFTDLSKVSDVKAAIDNMCEVLLSSSADQNYVNFIGKTFVSYVQSEYYNTSIYYQGSFTWLYDIGYITKMIADMSAATLSDGSANQTENVWSELNEAANAVLSKLSDAIVYSWRDSMLSASNMDFYYRLDGDANYEHYYGLSIAGSTLAINGGKLVEGNLASFYKTDLKFGKESKWGDLLAHWFGEQ